MELLIRSPTHSPPPKEPFPPPRQEGPSPSTAGQEKGILQGERRHCGLFSPRGDTTRTPKLGASTRGHCSRGGLKTQGTPGAACGGGDGDGGRCSAKIIVTLKNYFSRAVACRFSWSDVALKRFLLQVLLELKPRGEAVVLFVEALHEELHGAVPRLGLDYMGVKEAALKLSHLIGKLTAV